MIVEGLLADVDGVKGGQLAIENDLIVEVGERLGPPDHAFGDDCLIFAGMGDVHIHAREDVTGREMHKESFSTAAAAALNGGVVHVADMPNNPAAPVTDETYAAKEKLVASHGLSVEFTLYAGI
ncbi:MAG: amidohydrolase family protein, partial [Planctomycetia bacterium]